MLNTEIGLSGLNVQSFASKPMKMDLEKGISPRLFKEIQLLYSSKVNFHTKIDKSWEVKNYNLKK